MDDRIPIVWEEAELITYLLYWSGVNDSYDRGDETSKVRLKMQWMDGQYRTVTLVGGMAAYSTVRRRYNTVVPVPTRSWISRGVKISCQSMRRKRIFPLPLHWTTPSCPPPKHQNISQSNGLTSITSITSITTKQTNLSNPEKQIQKRNRTNLTRAAEPSSNRIFFLMHPHASSCMRSGNLTSIVHRVVELLVERSEKREGEKKKSFIRLACIQGLFLEIWTIAREFCTIEMIESYSTGIHA